MSEHPAFVSIGESHNLLVREKSGEVVAVRTFSDGNARRDSERHWYKWATTGDIEVIYSQGSGHFGFCIGQVFVREDSVIPESVISDFVHDADFRAEVVEPRG
jgi:hypothetical protein